MGKSRSVGTKFTIGGKTVGGLTSIGGVEVSSETSDVTSLDNADGYKEFLGGFKDGGEVKHANAPATSEDQFKEWFEQTFN